MQYPSTSLCLLFLLSYNPAFDVHQFTEPSSQQKQKSVNLWFIIFDMKKAEIKKVEKNRNSQQILGNLSLSRILTSISDNLEDQWVVSST